MLFCMLCEIECLVNGEKKENWISGSSGRRSRLFLILSIFHVKKIMRICLRSKKIKQHFSIRLSLRPYYYPPASPTEKKNLLKNCCTPAPINTSTARIFRLSKNIPCAIEINYRDMGDYKSQEKQERALFKRQTWQKGGKILCRLRGCCIRCADVQKKLNGSTTHATASQPTQNSNTSPSQYCVACATAS